MIHRVTAVNFKNDRLVMELRSPEKSGLLISDITGVGSGKGIINLTEYGSVDGAVYNSSRVGPRNIVFTIRFMETSSIEETRHISYKFFPIKQPVTLIFETDTGICEITGYVEYNQPNIFSSAEETQISIICPFPYFKSSSEQITLFYGISGEFEFPFSNESLIDPLLLFGTINNTVNVVLMYEGHGETGLILTLTAIGNVSGITIYNRTTSEIMNINSVKLSAIIPSSSSDMETGDVIILNTLIGQKSVTFFRNGIKYNILNAIDRDTDWLHLINGENIFSIIAIDGVANLHIKASNPILYEGV